MELRHLRYLVAIADAGSFVRAAAALNVAQPALSRQIHDLEREVGAELFDSKAYRASLTPSGESAVRLARRALSDAESAVQRARMSNRGVAGRCVIAAGPLPIISGIVPRFVEHLAAHLPGISLAIVERAGREQWDALVRGEADIGLGVPPAESFPALEWETQHAFTLDRVLVSPAHPIAARPAVTLTELLDFPYLWFDAVSGDFDGVRAALARAVKRAGDAPERLRAQLFPTFETLMNQLRAGRGWTLAPSQLVDRVGGLVAVKLSGFSCPLRAARIWRADEGRDVVSTVLGQLRHFEAEEAGAKRNAAASADAEAAGEANPLVARLGLRHLRSFVAVGKHGSLGRAAESLDVSQPALSRQMRELEHDVGAALLDREARGARLTPAGESFLRDAADVLALVEEIPAEVARARRGIDRRCVIGVVPGAAVDRLLAAATAELEGSHPRVHVEMRNVPSPDQPDALRAGLIDVGVGYAPPVPSHASSSASLVQRRIMEDRLSTALLAAGHPLARAASLSVHDLEDIPFLWVSRQHTPRYYDAVMARFAAIAARPRVDATYDGVLTLWSLAAQGLGWTLGWASHREEPPAGLRAVPLRDFDMELGIEVSYRREESRPATLAAIDAIVARAPDVRPA